MATSSWRADLGFAFTRNLVPGLLLQVVAIGLVVVHRLVPSAQPVFRWLAELKIDGGLLVSALATALSAAVIPWLVERFRQPVSEQRSASDLLALALFWAYRGIEVDLFYRLQGQWFGNGHDLGTIVPKVVVDMLGYAPLWAQPTVVLFYRWREHRWSWRATWQGWGWRGWLRSTLILQIGGWMVWIPAVSAIYSMPAELQFPLFAIVLCFWSLLVSVLSAKHSPEKTAA